MHAKKRQPLTELGEMKQGRSQGAGGAGGGPNADLDGSHLAKGSWADLGAVNGGDVATADDLYN